MAEKRDDIHNEAAANPSTVAPVDIESMQVKLLVICKNERRLDAMASFLNRRGWETKVTSKIKEALALTSTMKPDFIMISVNHPNPKLMRLPLVIKQTFKIPCIGFCEVAGAKSMGLLQQMPVDHRMSGLASGPNAQRSIKQILREIYAPETVKNERRALGLGEDGKTVIRVGDKNLDHVDYVAVKGESHEDDGYHIVQKNEAPGVTSISSPAEDLAVRELPTVPPIEEDDSDVTMATPEMISEELQLSPEEIEDIIRGIQKDYPSSSEISDVARELLASERETETQAKAAPEGQTNNQAGNQQVNPPRPPELESQSPLDQQDQQTAKEARGVQPVPLIRNEQDIANRQLTRSAEHQTYFEKLVIKILNDIPGAAVSCENRLNMVDRMVLVSVQSATTSGFLLFANSASDISITEMSTSFVEGLSEFLRQEGKIYDMCPLTYLLTDPHAFFNHRRDILEFAHLRPIGNGEMGVKFIPAEEPIPKLCLDEQNDKYRFRATAISPIYPIDFKLYLHLEKNERFVVLVKEGGLLNEKYKDRLEELDKGLFIESRDVDLLKRYSAAVKVAELLNLNAKKIQYGRRRVGKKAA